MPCTPSASRKMVMITTILLLLVGVASSADEYENSRNKLPISLLHITATKNKFIKNSTNKGLCNGVIVTQRWGIGAAKCILGLFELAAEMRGEVRAVLVTTPFKGPYISQKLVETRIPPGAGDIILFRFQNPFPDRYKPVDLPKPNFKMCEKPHSIEFRSHGRGRCLSCTNFLHSFLGGIAVNFEVFFSKQRPMEMQQIGATDDMRGQQNTYPPAYSSRGGPKLIHCQTPNRTVCEKNSGLPLLCDNKLVGVEVDCRKQIEPPVMGAEGSKEAAEARGTQSIMYAFWNVDYANVYKSMRFIAHTIENKSSHQTTSTSAPEPPPKSKGATSYEPLMWSQLVLLVMVLCEDAF